MTARLIILLLAAAPLTALPSFTGLTQRLTVQVKRRPADTNWTARATDVLDPSRPALHGEADPPRSRFGGRTDRRSAPTGHFRVERIDGRWRMLDPEGCEFISIGLCSVRADAGPDFRARFGDPAAWARATAGLMTSNGFNTLACWSDGGHFTTGGCPRPYTPLLNLMSGYGRQRGGTRQGSGHTLYPGDCIFVFDPDFVRYCEEAVAPWAARAADPWILGFFSDNELPLGRGLLARYRALPAAEAGHQAAERWVAERRNQGRPEADDEAAFTEHVVERYCGIVRAALRAHVPNHLFLGPRLHGSALHDDAVLRACGRQVDVLSFNYYGAWTPQPETMDRWVRVAGRPFLITEWYAKAEDSGLANTSGAGWLVRTQADRAAFYQHFALGLLAHPGCLGWHWFKYRDNDPADRRADPSNRDANKGVVNLRYEPYDALLDGMRELNTRVYTLRDTAQ